MDKVEIMPVVIRTLAAAKLAGWQSRVQDLKKGEKRREKKLFHKVVS